MTSWRNRLASAVNTAKHIKANREGPGAGGGGGAGGCGYPWMDTPCWWRRRRSRRRGRSSSSKAAAAAAAAAAQQQQQLGEGTPEGNGGGAVCKFSSRKLVSYVPQFSTHSSCLSTHRVLATLASFKVQRPRGPLPLQNPQGNDAYPQEHRLLQRRC